jgi:hypothetical protein
LAPEREITLKNFTKSVAIAVAFPIASALWSAGFLAASFALQTQGSVAYLFGTVAFLALLVERLL